LEKAEDSEPTSDSGRDPSDYAKVDPPKRDAGPGPICALSIPFRFGHHWLYPRRGRDAVPLPKMGRCSKVSISFSYIPSKSVGKRQGIALFPDARIRGANFPTIGENREIEVPADLVRRPEYGDRYSTGRTASIGA
jgi:hypothetical protein